MLVVISCGFDQGDNGNKQGPIKPEPPTIIKELSQNNDGFDYVYDTKNNILKLVNII
ncbi:hypothetical protein [Spiroplasma cantharicola]|uniref:hypothetical protein n=1 Tax=Spiroplasma cantharicola TaxID=362837 RepID=UPI001F28FE3E|nr:hypothetical protein [Spiroplasma cantharicola]